MYLSRLILNTRNAQSRKEISFPYQLHRTLLRAFHQGNVNVKRSDNDAAGVLFRMEADPRRSWLSVLVQSKTAPDWTFLDNQRDSRGQPYLLPADPLSEDRPNPAVMEYDLHQKLRPGQVLAYRLRANPTKKLGKSAGEAQGKRVGITDEIQQLDWLRRKAEAGGFHILQVYTSKDGRIAEIVKRPDREDQKMAFYAVQFDGLLEVLDVAKLAETVANGIGSAKGFGFGLLSLAPA